MELAHLPWAERKCYVRVFKVNLTNLVIKCSLDTPYTVAANGILPMSPILATPVERATKTGLVERSTMTLLLERTEGNQ